MPPPWRVDMHRQVDLIEEVGRHHGFEHLPTTFPGVEQAPPPSDPRIARDRRVRTALLGMGFSEAITFAFIEAAAAEPFLDAPTAAGGARQSVVREVRRHAAEPVARTRRRRSATIGATGGPTSASSRSARASRRRVKPAARRSRGWDSARPITGAARGGRWISPTSRVSSSNSRRSRRFPSPSRRPSARSSCADAPANILINGQVIGVLGQLSPEIGEARDLPADERGLRRRAQSRRCHGRVAHRDAPRDHTAALPVRRARRVDSRREHLVCGNGSWHHSVGRARHARAGARVRSLRGQGRSGRQGQPLVPFDVPITRTDADG